MNMNGNFHGTTEFGEFECKLKWIWLSNLRIDREILQMSRMDTYMLPWKQFDDRSL